MRERPFQPCVYILASQRNGTLYTGVTSDPVRRVWEHREGLGAKFAKRYGVSRLVWFELHSTMDTAIQREKRIKTWNRAWKLRLIEETNPRWLDLFDDLAG
jgi:putative endonuclease